MSADPQAPVRWFRPTLMTIGVTYVLLGSSMVVRGPVAMRDFEVPEHITADPVFGDFFMFFFQLMMFVGVLTALCGWVAQTRRAQLLVARVFFVANVLIFLRDLSTSDCRWGNRLYRGDGTLVPVFIDVLLMVVFGFLSLGGLPPRVTEGRVAAETRRA